MKKLIIILSLLILIVAVGFAALRVIGGKKVDVITPRYGQAVSAVYATGTVEATVMMPIAPRISARLMALEVDEGAQVSKDQVLAQLEDSDLQSAVKQYQAAEQLAKITFERKQKLLRSGTITKADFDDAKAKWDLAKAQLERASSEKGFTQLLAPADGLIIKRDGEIGQLIPAAQPVFWLSCCAPLRITAEVNEEDIAQVQPQQEVLIRADAFPDTLIHGHVASITPMGDSVARTYRVRITLEEKHPLHIGMTTENNIIISRTDKALLVPSSALAGTKLWVVREGALHAVNVKTGAKGENSIEIREGITDKDRIVKEPAADLEEGQRVRPASVSF